MLYTVQYLNTIFLITNNKYNVYIREIRKINSCIFAISSFLYSLYSYTHKLILYCSKQWLYFEYWLLTLFWLGIERHRWKFYYYQNAENPTVPN